MAPKSGLSLGAKAPDFTLLDFHRQPYTLSSALKRGPVVLVFFRGGWCPYCCAYLRRAQAELAAPVKALGASIAALSSDSPGIPADEVDKQSLSFPILSDPEGKVLAQLDAVNHLTKAEYEAERQWHDLEAYSLNKLHIIAVPGVTVLDRRGIVIFNELNLDLRKRPEPKKILAALEGA